MATISERTKDVLRKLTNSDGKIVVTDDMSDDLKEAIQYINENNVDIFNTDIDQSEIVDNEDDVEEDEEFSESEIGGSSDVEQLEPLELFDDSELDDSETDELGNFL